MGMVRETDPARSEATWRDRAHALAASHKPGSIGRASTALRHLDTYLADRRRRGLSWRLRQLCSEGVALPPLSPDGSTSLYLRLLNRVGSTLLEAVVDTDSNVSILFDFGRYCYDIAGVPTLESVLAYVREVQGFLRRECDVNIPVPPVLVKAVLRDSQAPKPDSVVVKQPCPKHLVAAVIRDVSAAPAIRLAAVLMWFATLRMGELASPSALHYDDAFSLRRCDVEVAPNGAMACLRLRKGKPDKRNKGSQRFICQAPSSAAFCPVEFLQAYLDATPDYPSDQPLLMFDTSRGRRCVTRHHVDSLIQHHARRLGIEEGSITLHCFRSGSATALVDHGSLSAMDLQVQGGWTSEQGPVPYLRHNIGTYTRASDALALSTADWRGAVDPVSVYGGAPRVGFGHKLAAVPRRSGSL